MNQKRSAFWQGFGSTVSLFGQPPSPIRFPKRARSPVEEVYRDLTAILGDVKKAVEKWNGEMKDKRGEVIGHGG